MITLFQHVPRIQVLLVTDNKNYNTPMNDRKILAVKGATNPLEIQILDSNRRPVRLLGKTIKFTLSKISYNEIYLDKILSLVDPLKSIYKAEITQVELEDIPSGLAQLAFYVVDGSGKRTPLIANLANKFTIDIDIQDGTYIIPIPDASDDLGLISSSTSAVEDYGSVQGYTEVVDNSLGQN